MNGQIRQMSKARAAQYAVYLKKRRAYLTEHRMCETHPLIFPGESVPKATDVHHKKGRMNERLLDEKEWAATCRKCHSWVHTFVKRARELGLIAQVGEWNKIVSNPRKA